MKRTQIRWLLFMWLVLFGSLSFKVYTTAIESDSFEKLTQNEIQEIKNSLTLECEQNEKYNLKISSETEEEEDWLIVKAPEYCKCVSKKIFFIASQEPLIRQYAESHEVAAIKNGMLQFVKSSGIRKVQDFCLTRAQRYSQHTQRNPADHSVSQPTTLPDSK